MSLIIRGIPQTRAALERVRLELEAAQPAAARAGGDVLANAMQSRAPRNTGRLAGSIQVVEVTGDTAKVGTDVPYARFVEFGTRFMAAQSFEEDAAGSSSSGIVGAMAAVFKAAIH